jgi:kinesin family protein 5
MEDDSGPSNIRVICRFRPINERERSICADKQVADFPPDQKTVIVNSQSEGGGPYTFAFDHVFTPAARQVDVYRIAAKPTVESVMQGFNGTVFAYGQTSSGKTFTMTGSDLNDAEYMGIIPRMVSTVFGEIEAADPKFEFQVKVGYCEIYLEKIKDLLDTSKTNLRVHEDRARGVYIADLTEQYVSSGGEVFELMRIGTSNREVGYTHMNAGSSRSHSIFILTITQTNSNDFSSKTGKLYLVDLAGSEKVGKTGAEGKRLEEAKNINKSLTMLGNVITALTDGKSSHVPYRDSKLTRVLQDSLGGNSKTSLIVTCSPSPFNEAETISTLRFGVRAKSIKNKPKVNKEYTVNELKVMLAAAKEEITKKDKMISTLKATLKNNGLTFIQPENTEGPENAERSETVENEEKDEKGQENSEIYMQVITELEDLRTKLTEEEGLSKKYKNHLENLFEENEQLKEDHNFIYKQIAVLQERLNITEEKSAQQGIEIESVRVELSSELQKKIQLEEKVREKDAELESLSMNGEIIRNLQEENKKLRESLEEEQKKNQELTWENEKINENLKANLTILNDDKQTKILEESHQQEKERWLQDNKNLKSEIVSRTKKMTDLQLLLEKEGEKYRALESQMSDSDKSMKKKIDTQQRNLEQLNLMYHQIVSQQSILKVNKSIHERKITRLTEKNAELERAFKELTEKLLSYERKEDEDQKKIQILEAKVRRTMGNVNLQSHNIKKVIRGGGDMIFKTPTNRKTISEQNDLNESTEID